MASITKPTLFGILAIAFAVFSLPVLAQDLWEAASEGDLKTINKLIKEGADVHARDPNLSFTPLHIAVMSNQPKAVRLLVKKGASAKSGTADGNTPLHAAVFLGYDDVVKELLRAGADPLIPNGQGQDAQAIADLDWQTTSYIASMLQIELQEDELAEGREKSKELMGKELEKRSKKDIWLAVSLGNERAAKRLIKKTEDLDAKHEQFRTTLIATAATLNHAGIVEELVKAGADVNVKSDDGATPLLIAAFFGRSDVVELLLDHGADKSITNNDGLTPLLAAQSDMAMVDYIAGLLGVPLDYDEVIDGKREAANLLAAD